jgi:predicted NAD/FAD-binding protein
MPRLAIIGSDISGLGTAWFVHRDYELTAGSGERCEPGLTLGAVTTAVP